ncbi:MAG: hypothetical protein ACOY5B_12680 [Spirochaetota bacterium]
MADKQAGNDRRDTGQPAPRTSFVGRTLRRLADFFDAAAPSVGFRASLGEVNLLTLLLTSAGILTIGTVIHGSGALGWLLLFNALFNAGVFLIFSSNSWPARSRTFVATLLALSALPAATERLLPMFLILLISCYLVLLLAKKWELPPNYLNVLLVLLYCYTSYGIFAATLEWRRNSALAATDGIAVDCRWQVERALVCSSGATSFDVPEFWKPAAHAHLIRDLAAIIDLETFADSATDNRIALAVFSSAPAATMRTITDYFNVQQKYLASKPSGGKTLTPQGIMKSRDAELYALSYRSPEMPGYLGTYADRNALILLHQPQMTQGEGRETTWLFIIDGTDLAAREFLLHRIITGFRRSP